jgi:hypothetical protein
MPDSGHLPTGLERITRLETEVQGVNRRLDDMRRDIEDVAASTKATESLLLEGRGAVRLAQWLIGAAALLGAGWFGHAKVAEVLKWLGS